jgi:GGDEF domain-containing protein
MPTEPTTLDEIAERLRKELRRGDYLLEHGKTAFGIAIPAALQQARDLGRAEPPLDPQVLMTWYRNHAGFHHLVDAFAVTRLDRVVNEVVADERKALREIVEVAVLPGATSFQKQILAALDAREKESR